MFKVTPEKKHSKLEKLVGQPVVADGVDLEQAEQGIVGRDGSRVAGRLVVSSEIDAPGIAVPRYSCRGLALSGRSDTESLPALDAINENDLLISPAVLIELNFLYQIGTDHPRAPGSGQTAAHADRGAGSAITRFPIWPRRRCSRPGRAILLI